MALQVNREAIWARCGYAPHEEQQLYHSSLARFKVAACGRRFGKSRMAAAEITPALMNPDLPVLGWIVGPQYSDGENEFKYVWEDMIALGVLSMKGVKKAYNARIGEMYIELPWGSRIEVKSAAKPTSLVGKGLHFLVVSEAAKQSRQTWEKYLRPTLADYKGWATFPSTPEGFNWFFDLYEEGQKPAEEQLKTECFGRDGLVPMFESWNFPSWKNPIVYPGGFEDPEVQSQLRTPDDPWFWQEIGASFRSVVGRIYQEWDDEKHIIDEYEYKPEWDNYLWMDFGFTNPFVALDVQVSPSDDIYIWREHYISKVPIHKHARDLRMRMHPEGYDIRCGFGDAADPEAVEVLSELLCPVTAEPESKDWARGVAEVKRFLIGEDDAPHLYVHRSCVNTIWEFQNYRMPENKDQENSQEKARKWADHCLVADTLITTARGQLPISRVVVGDSVLTRNGWRDVVGSAQTGKDAQVYEVEFSDGKCVTGTGNHRIWTHRGWVAIDSLRYGDRIEVCESFDVQSASRKSHSRALSSVVIPTLRSGLKGLTSSLDMATVRGAWAGFTKRFGSTIAGLYRRVTQSITRTSTRSTTRSAILNVSPVPNMGSDIGAAARLLSEQTLSASVLRHPSGIALKQDERGTQSTDAGPGKVAPRPRSSATPVGLSTRLSSPLAHVFAPMRAKLESYVVGVRPKGTADVFDLTVEGEHEFFANGVLVHNSMDAIRYGIMHLFVLGAGRYSMKDLMDIREIPDKADGGIFTGNSDSLFTMDSGGMKW